MTPLSRALLRLQNNGPASLAAARPVINIDQAVTPAILPIDGGPQEAREAISPPTPALPKPTGILRLGCDATPMGLSVDDPRPFDAERWVFVDTGSGELRSRTPRPADADWPIGWPAEAHAAEVAGTADSSTVRLTVGPAGFKPREGVLLLDACRRAFASTAIIVPASQEQLIDWLARRCDEVWLMAQSGATEVDHARVVANRLAQASRRRPNCVLLPAA